MTQLDKFSAWLNKQDVPPGPPSREGLEWKPSTHRWIRPEEISPVIPKLDKPISLPEQKVKDLADSMLHGRDETLLTAKQVSYLQNVIEQHLPKENFRKGSLDRNPTYKVYEFSIGNEQYSLGYWSRTGGGGRLINQSEKSRRNPLPQFDPQKYIEEYNSLTEILQSPELIKVPEVMVKAWKDKLQELEKKLKDAGYKKVED